MDVPRILSVYICICIYTSMEEGERNKSTINGEDLFRTVSRKEAVRMGITNGIIIEIRRWRRG